MWPLLGDVYFHPTKSTPLVPRVLKLSARSFFITVPNRGFCFSWVSIGSGKTGADLGSFSEYFWCFKHLGI